jgi:hypothetical protein
LLFLYVKGMDIDNTVSIGSRLWNDWPRNQHLIPTAAEIILHNIWIASPSLQPSIQWIQRTLFRRGRRSRMKHGANLSPLSSTEMKNVCVCVCVWSYTSTLIHPHSIVTD